VTYAIAIFILNQFIAFLTPKIDPAMQDYEGEFVGKVNRSLWKIIDVYGR